MLAIKNLHAGVEEKEILKGINLEVNPGEIHAIMGPNGAGKSTFASIIAGKEDFEVSQGQILFEGEDLADLAPEERAHKGVFLSFQYPVEIPGVTVTNFIKTAINETRKAQGLDDMPAGEMLKKIKEVAELLDIETDSGLDIDALKIVANGVNKLRSKDNAVIVITHYQRLLDYIVPDFVHVLMDGKIVKSGTKELALELESKGYDWIKEELN
jgi:Fe-S cluster assembly ATP-binding protein